MKLCVIVFSVRRSRYSRLKSLQVEHLVRRNICKQFGQTGWQTARTWKLESYHPLYFITKGSYTVAFFTIQFLEDIRRSNVLIKTNVILLFSAHYFLRMNPTSSYFTNILSHYSHLIRLGGIKQGHENWRHYEVSCRISFLSWFPGVTCI